MAAPDRNYELKNKSQLFLDFILFGPITEKILIVENQIL